MLLFDILQHYTHTHMKSEKFVNYKRSNKLLFYSLVFYCRLYWDIGGNIEKFAS